MADLLGLDFPHGEPRSEHSEKTVRVQRQCHPIRLGD